MPELSLVKPNGSPTAVMPQRHGDDDNDDLNIPLHGPAALLRQDIRYLDRSLSELKSLVRDELGVKADRIEVPNATVADHEQRIRRLETRMYWGLGFAAAIGSIAGLVTKLLFH
jgi:hypothetical protein